MAKYAVVTDSASDIPKEYAEKLDINIIPIYINYDGKSYKDRVDIDAETVYMLQKEKNAIFKSSSPSPFDFVKIYEKLLKDYEKIISIHISSKLSAVIKAAIVAKNYLNAGDKIEIFDSLSGSMGTGLMALAAAKACKKEMDFNSIISNLEFLRKNMKLFGTINTLKYLSRSGRVPEIANIVTSVTRIKPILGIFDGIVKMMGVSITRVGSLKEIANRTIKSFKNEKWVAGAIIHSLSYEESKKIMLRIQPKINFVSTIITECTPVVGAHTGPGLIGIIATQLNDELKDLFIEN